MDFQHQVIKYSSVKYETIKLQKIYLVCAAKILQSLVLSNMTFHRIERESFPKREFMTNYSGFWKGAKFYAPL